MIQLLFYKFDIFLLFKASLPCRSSSCIVCVSESGVTTVPNAPGELILYCIYRWPSLYADFLSAIKIMAFQRNVSSNLPMLLVSLYANLLYASQFFRSLSIAYNEDRLYIGIQSNLCRTTTLGTLN